MIREPRRKKNRHGAFGRVQDKREDSSERPHNPSDVCCSDIAAARLSNVRSAEESSQNYTEGNRAKKVRGHWNQVKCHWNLHRTRPLLWLKRPERKSGDRSVLRAGGFQVALNQV